MLGRFILHSGSLLQYCAKNIIENKHEILGNSFKLDKFTSG